MTNITNVIDINDFKAASFARDFIAKHGAKEFGEFQELLLDYLELCEDEGLVPQEIINEFGSIKEFRNGKR